MEKSLDVPSLFLIKSVSQLHISAIPQMSTSALTGLKESQK